jgi:hypothetical protein
VFSARIGRPAESGTPSPVCARFLDGHRKVREMAKAGRISFRRAAKLVADSVCCTGIGEAQFRARCQRSATLSGKVKSRAALTLTCRRRRFSGGQGTSGQLFDSLCPLHRDRQS